MGPFGKGFYRADAPDYRKMGDRGLEAEARRLTAKERPDLLK